MNNRAMLFTQTSDAMHAFGKYVVQQSRSRLSKAKTTKGTLYNSINYRFEMMPNSLIIKFPFMKDIDYAKYQDLGVKGTKSVYPNTRTSPFKFGTGTGKKGGLTKSIDKWIKSKRFQFQQPKKIKVKGKEVDNPKAGKFMSYKTMTFLISRSIYQKGIPAKHFYSKSFDLGYNKLPKEIIEAFALDVKEAFKKYTVG
jgi:hypothetical protein|tara:strand:- start:9708 stop:10298 length:591 start_codon:yes stop_codon:yes gene_type:complete